MKIKEKLNHFGGLVLGCIDSYDSERERERERNNILRNPLTATCDDGTLGKPANLKTKEEQPRGEKEQNVNHPCNSGYSHFVFN